MGTGTGANVEVVITIERYVEPPEVTTELEVKMTGGAVLIDHEVEVDVEV